MRKKPNEYYIDDCPVCREPVYQYDDRYELDVNTVIHEDCLREWAAEYYKESGVE